MAPDPQDPSAPEDDNPGTPSSHRGGTTPTGSGEAGGSAHRQPGRLGAGPDPVDQNESNVGAMLPGGPRGGTGLPDVRGKSDLAGVSSPAQDAAPGTSEESAPVQGVRYPTVAPPAAPDGEVAT